MCLQQFHGQENICCSALERNSFSCPVCPKTLKSIAVHIIKFLGIISDLGNMQTIGYVTAFIAPLISSAFQGELCLRD